MASGHIGRWPAATREFRREEGAAAGTTHQSSQVPVWASDKGGGRGEVDLLSFMGLNERRHRQERHVIGEIFVFYLYTWNTVYIKNNFAKNNGYSVEYP